MATVSLIFRVKNEEKWLGAALLSLTRQTFQDFEVVVVDSGSTDRTLAIVEEFQGRLNITICLIAPENFTYPYACNVGAKAATGELIGYLSGHSIPVHPTYLEVGMKHFTDPEVIGVYGPQVPLDGATVWDKLIYQGVLTRAQRLRMIAGRKARRVTKMRVGTLGNTNTLLRRSAWLAHTFDERLAEGGEDIEWASYWLNQRKVIVWEPGMVVFHSHYNSFSRTIWQLLQWNKVHRQALRLTPPR